MKGKEAVREIELTAEQRAAIDEMLGGIASMTQQKNGMILLLARMHGLKDATVDYRDGKLIVTALAGTQ